MEESFYEMKHHSVNLRICANGETNQQNLKMKTKTLFTHREAGQVTVKLGSSKATGWMELGRASPTPAATRRGTEHPTGLSHLV